MSAETSKTEPCDDLKVGDKIKHSKFGEGQILHRSGLGKETKFVVAFVEEGEKRLLARYAHLKKLHPIGEEESRKAAEAPAEAAEKTVREKPSAPRAEEEGEEGEGDFGLDEDVEEEEEEEKEEEELEEETKADEEPDK